MSITRREFLRATGIATASVLSGCESGQSSPQYQAYLDHISERGIGLPDGKILRYIEFEQPEFEYLNTLIDTPILIFGKDLDIEGFSVPKEDNKAQMFLNIINKVGASRLLTFRFGSVNLSFYSNQQNIEFTFDPKVANALYGWAYSNPSLKSSIYTGDIDHHVLIGKFAVNPLYPELINSTSATFIGDSGIKTVLTVINTKANTQIYGTPDTALVTELMQGYLNSGWLLQEQQANSISLAYQYATK